MKQVLVVGAGGGLGKAVVKHLLVRNIEVAACGRTKTAPDGVRHSYVIDATSADWHSLYETIEKESASPLDAVIFVAGTASYGRTALVPAGQARAIFELNFWACTSAATLAAEHWASRGREGTFLAVLSIAGRRAVPFEAHYCASKAAAARFLECLDLEYGPKRIRFVSAFPGTLNTGFRQNAEWYGIGRASCNGGADVQQTAQEIWKLLEGTRKVGVIGRRERIIDLADRFAPGLYDRVVLKRRVAAELNKGVPQRPPIRKSQRGQK